MAWTMWVPVVKPPKKWGGANLYILYIIIIIILYKNLHMEAGI